MQTLNLIHTGSHAVKHVVEALLFNDLSGCVKNEHRVWPHIMVDLFSKISMIMVTYRHFLKENSRLSRLYLPDPGLQEGVSRIL
jgi:hypothetical protein